MKKNLSNVLILLSFLLVLLGCSREKENPVSETPVDEPESAAVLPANTVRGYEVDENGTIVNMDEDVVYIRPDVDKYIQTYDEGSGVIVFENTDAVRGMNFKVGDVLYSATPNEKHPDGFCVLITALHGGSGTKAGVGDYLSADTVPASPLDYMDIHEVTPPDPMCYSEKNVHFYSTDNQPDFSQITDQIFSDADMLKYLPPVSVGKKLSIDTSIDQTHIEYTLLDEKEGDFSYKVVISGDVKHTIHDITKDISKSRGVFMVDFNVDWGATLSLELQGGRNNLNGERMSEEELKEFRKGLLKRRDKLVGRQVQLMHIDIPMGAGNLIANPAFEVFWDFRIEEIKGDFKLTVGAVNATTNFHFENTESWDWMSMKKPMMTEVTPAEKVFNIEGHLEGKLSTGPYIGFTVEIPALRYTPDGTDYKRVRKWKNFKGRTIPTFVGGFFALLLEGDIGVELRGDVVNKESKIVLTLESSLRLDLVVEYLLGVGSKLIGYDQMSYTVKRWPLGKKEWSLTDDNIHEFCVYPKHNQYIDETDVVDLQWSSNRNTEGKLLYDVYVGPSADKMSLVANDIEDTHFGYTPLRSGEFFWKITVWDGTDEFESQVWSFVIGNKYSRPDKVGEPVDLGIGLLWADHNLGASRPEEDGDYYSWGGIETQFQFGWPDYRFCVNASKHLYKYCYNPLNGDRDDKLFLDAADDAASRHWGDNWRTPTIWEWKDLLLYCVWEWQDEDGIYGFEVTGPNGKKIFLPAAGKFDENELSDVGKNLYYWTSVGHYDFSDNMVRDDYKAFAEVSEKVNSGSAPAKPMMCEMERRLGLPIRPVKGAFSPDRGPRVEFGTDVLDVGLVVIGSQKTTALTIKNTGTMFLAIKPVDPMAPFSIDSRNTKYHNIAPGEMTTVDVIFAPTAKGAFSADLKFETNIKDYEGGVRLMGYACQDTSVVALCHPEAVDMGTIVNGKNIKWASCNIGASKPEEYGDYYAWGETVPYYLPGHAYDNPCNDWKDEKTGYDWISYKWCNGSWDSLTKYNTQSNLGTVDNKTVLESEDDVAHVKLGGKWRMPTYAEWKELIDKCTWIWTDNYNGTGIAGRIVTSNKAGYTDKSIFFPAAGCRDDTYLRYVGAKGYYWGSSIIDSPRYACYVPLDSINVGYGSFHRRLGYSVRPVTE